MSNRPSRWVQLQAVVRKETLQTVRDRRVMFMLIVAPLLQSVVFGYAVNFKVDRVPTVVIDQDGTPASREAARRLLADGTLVRAGTGRAPAEGEAALESGAAAAALVLPRDFARTLDRGDSAEVQVLIDGTDPNRATVAASAVGGYFAARTEELAQLRLAALGTAAAAARRPPQIGLEPRVRYNPTLDSPPFMVPGVLAMLLIVVTTIVTAMGLAREREIGTLEQVLVTPLHPTVLLIGKLIPFVVVGVLDVALVLTMGAYLFQVPLRGSFAVLAAGALLYLLTTIAVGLFISTVSKTQQQAFLGGFLFAMPAILLSGVMTPIRSMPGWLQAVTYLNPPRYVTEVLRGCLLKGAGFAELWPQLAALAFFGVGLIAWASLRFHKTVA